MERIEAPQGARRCVVSTLKEAQRVLMRNWTKFAHILRSEHGGYCVVVHLCAEGCAMCEQEERQRLGTVRRAAA